MTETGPGLFDRPIETILQAKAFFRAMRCSHFHIDRDFPERAREYDRLGISRQTERQWIEEQFEEYHDCIVKGQETEELWILHSRMYDLFLSLRSQTALLKLLQVTGFIREKIPLRDRVIVAETINGRTVRKARQGLIYLAYDFGNTTAARQFAQLSLHFSKCDPEENRGKDRNERAVKLCQEISSELKL